MSATSVARSSSKRLDGAAARVHHRVAPARHRSAGCHRRGGRSRGDRIPWPQANCHERLDRPYQKPSIVDVAGDWSVVGPIERATGPPPTVAPRVTNSGAKCSVRGWATWAAGPLCPKSRTASRSHAASASVDPGVELGRPRRGGGVGRRLHVDQAQVVGRESAAEDQHALVTQRCQPATDLEQPLRVERRHGDLQGRDIGRRVHLDQRHVGAVVEAAVGCVVGAESRYGEQLANLRGELAAPRVRRTSPGSSAGESPRSRRPGGPSSWPRWSAAPPPSARRSPGSRAAWAGPPTRRRARWSSSLSSASGGAPWLR